MFSQDTSRTYVDVKRDQIITLLTSTIRPHVAIIGPTEPADAYICTVKAGDKYETSIFFHLVDSHKGVVYSWDEGPQPRGSAKAVEKEALRFLDEMGFQMDSLHFRKKSTEEKDKMIETMSLFQPVLEAPEEEIESVELLAIDETDEVGDDIEEITVEHLEEDDVEVAEVEADVETESIESEFVEIPEPVQEAVAVEPEVAPAESIEDAEGLEEVVIGEEPVAEAAIEEDVLSADEVEATVIEAEDAPVEEFVEEAEAVGAVDATEAFEESFAEEFPAEAEATDEIGIAEAAKAFEEEMIAEAAPVSEAESVQEIAEPEPLQTIAEEPPVQPRKETAPPAPPPIAPVTTPPALVPQPIAGAGEGLALDGVDLNPLARFLASM